MGTDRRSFLQLLGAGAAFQVRSGNDQDGPWTYTLGANDEVSDVWSLRATHEAAYDLTCTARTPSCASSRGASWEATAQA